MPKVDNPMSKETHMFYTYPWATYDSYQYENMTIANNIFLWQNLAMTKENERGQVQLGQKIFYEKNGPKLSYFEKKIESFTFRVLQ